MESSYEMTTLKKLSVVTPADWIPGPEQGKWTYDEYAALSEEGQFDVVNGVLYMSPARSWNHQSILGEIFAHLRSFVQVAGLGIVGMGPFNIELSSHTIVQPDVFVLLEEHRGRLTGARIIGYPDLIVEIVSPGTARHDLHEKLKVYAQAGVPEYWVVNPDAHTIELLVLKNGVYRSPGIFSGNAILPSVVLPGFPVQVSQFFVTL